MSVPSFLYISFEKLLARSSDPYVKFLSVFCQHPGLLSLWLVFCFGQAMVRAVWEVLRMVSCVGKEKTVHISSVLRRAPAVCDRPFYPNFTTCRRTITRYVSPLWAWNGFKSWFEVQDSEGGDKPINCMMSVLLIAELWKDLSNVGKLAISELYKCKSFAPDVFEWFDWAHLFNSAHI